MSDNPKSLFVPLDDCFYTDEREANHYDAIDQKRDGFIEFVPKEEAHKQTERMKMICLSLRDAAIKYHNSKIQTNLEELERCTDLCNDKTMIEDIPYVSEVVTSHRKSHEKVVTIMEKELKQARDTIETLREQNKAMYKKLTDIKVCVAKDLT